MDTLTLSVIVGQAIAIAAAVIGGVIKIEKRLTRLETQIEFIKDNCHRCQPTSETPTK